MAARQSAIVSGALPGSFADMQPRAPAPVVIDPADTDFGAGLRSHLLQDYQSGKMDAVQLCTLAYHITRAGGQGVSDLALEPSNRHANDHVRGVLGSRVTTAFYVTGVPMWCKTEEGRMFLDFPINLPHEEFASCFAESPEDFKVTPDSDLPR